MERLTWEFPIPTKEEWITKKQPFARKPKTNRAKIKNKPTDPLAMYKRK